MAVFTFEIKFLSDGAHLIRTEWGKTRKQALRTIESIYGRETFVVVRG